MGKLSAGQFEEKMTKVIKGTCKKCKNGKSRRLNEEGICFHECLKNENKDGGPRGDDGAAPDGQTVPRNEEEAQCGQCKKLVNDSSPSMQCEACYVWFHLAPCCNIDIAKYNALENGGLLKVVRWFCASCDKSIIKLACELTEIKERLKRLEEKTEIKTMVEATVREHLNEKEEIEKRKNSLIIHGIPEPATDTEDEDGEIRNCTAQEKKDADIVKLQSLTEASADLRIEDGSMVSLHRLGAVRDDGNPRPLCIKFRDLETRRRLLSNARVLNKSKVPWHKKVYVNPDLTKAQREKDRAARSELKRRRDNGETNLIIRNFMVVTKQRQDTPNNSRVGHVA